jgi:hypothetical protein
MQVGLLVGGIEFKLGLCFETVTPKLYEFKFHLVQLLPSLICMHWQGLACEGWAGSVQVAAKKFVI